MEVNIALSLEMKKNYHTKIGHCYTNTKKLLLNRECEYLVIGYCSFSEGKSWIRHSWNINNNEIIDCTLRKNDFKLNPIYIDLFTFNIDNYYHNIIKTSGPHMLELDPGKEEMLKNILKEKYNTKIFI